MASRTVLGESFPTKDFEKQIATAALAILSEARVKARVAGVVCETMHVPASSPAEGVLKAAASSGSDLIVVATHGLSGLSRLVMGSQASEFIAGAKVPVLVCR